MLKGYRGALLALGLSILLLAVVLLTRPAPVELLPTATSIALVKTNPPTPTPLATFTPAPTIPFQKLDTSTLHEALISPDCVVKLNPLLAGYNRADRDMTSLIFEGLMTTDQHGTDVPDLAAEAPRASSDGLVYAVKLRTDVLWQDGQTFSSADVVFTLNLMQDPDFPGPADLHNFWQTVEVDAIDARTVRFKLVEPLATFPDYLRIGILPQHVLKGTPAAALRTHPFNLSPIGTGPYQFDGLIGNGPQPTGLRLRFAAAYQQRPEGKDGFALKQIVFHCLPTFNDAIAAFQRGEVNTISQVPAESLAQIAALPLTIYTEYRHTLGAVIYNWQRDNVNFFRDIRMRQALARSVDRTAIVNKYLPGRAVAANGPILPNSWAYAAGTSCPNFDTNQPDAAKIALSQVQIQPPTTPNPNATAAATVDPKTSPVPVVASIYRFEVLVSNDPTQAKIAEDLINSWQALGLKASLLVVDKPTFKQRLVAGNFDAALVELNLEPGADPDPYSLWRQSPAEGGLNFGGLNERRLSEEVEGARRATNGADRVQLYRDFQRLFCDRAAALILYYPVYYFGADGRIAGIQLGFMSDPSDRFRTIRDWRFVEQSPPA